MPASFGQQRLWFVAQMFPDSPTYNEAILVQIPGPVDATVLARSLTEITRRHEAWRTTFTTVDGLPVQQIQPPHPFDLPVVDLTSLPFEEREPECARLARASARLPFDLQKGPLVRALFLKLTESEARLLVSAHHIAVDGVSFFQVFLPELSTLYLAFSKGQPSPLPEPRFQSADFAVWQRRWLTEEELAPKLAYWRAHLAGAGELDLPTDHPRPSEPSERGARANVALPAELMGRLRELGHQAGATLFTTLLAAWKTLLFRLTGQGDVVVGSAAAGRPRPEFEGLIGFFNNNLVLRTQLDGSLTFLELLARVHEVMRAAREHQDVPFDRLVSALKVDRSSTKNPLYNNVFLLMPPLPPASEPPQWSASRFDIGTAKVDLYLELHQRPSGLVGHLEYQTELFSPATIERMIGHLQTLLEGIVRDPEQRLSELPLLTAAEQQQLSAWQGPAVAPLPDSEIVSLERLFEAQAARSPSAIAVEHRGQRLTYQELNARANQLAHHLRSQGVGPDCLVGLCVTRSFDAMVGILGVLKAGGAYVPLDPDYPAERLRFLLEDANIEILLADSRSASAVRQHRGRTIFIDRDWPAIARSGAHDPAPVATAAHLAYVIYTSGSTGLPKGVLVERRGLFHLAKAQEQRFGLGVGSRILQFFSLNFDVSVWELAMAWTVGATLVLADREALLPGSTLTQLLEQQDIHVLVVTPSALLVTPYQALPALHTLIVAGEAVPEELVRRWAPGRRFFNGYGPTETTVVSVIAECRAGEGKPPIGIPFGFVQVHILDSCMRPVPIGVPGELYIGGPGVARGYLNRPMLTMDRFLVSPLQGAAGARLYKTGDLAKWRPDGSIDYLGRTDRQIKLRGFRIELGEVEAALSSHAAVQHVAVTLWERGPTDRLLLAYVSLREALGADASAQLIDWLRQRLPSYMVPAAVLCLDALPLLPSGKTDYKALPVPSALPDAPGAAYRAPNSDLDRALTRIWQAVLKRDKVGIHDNFFDVGGHSLLLAAVQGRIVAELGREIPLVVLYKHPTVSALASYLEKGENGGSLPRASQEVSGVLTTAHERGQRRARQSKRTPVDIALVGMSGRFPGAANIEAFWRNLCEGVESITFFSRRELLLAGVAPELVDNPSYVPASGHLADLALFDAGFFGFNAAEAEITDPQHRLLLECAWEALEDAGYDPRRYPGAIGVFVGSGPEQYLHRQVMSHPRVRETFGDYLLQVANGRDFLATRIAYKLDLKGPCMTVLTACSTSLVAVSMACQSLLDHECDIALAGGASSNLAMQYGYMYREGMVFSPDGHCRAFDADANGIVGGDGVGVVTLKRLSDALSEGDSIHAVLKGAALNNDGADKVGYAAPGVQGQSRAIMQALGMAGIEPDSVTYIETHGTGTQVGDPIEIAALMEVFRRSGARAGSCALGAVKTNIGHLDAAAGIAGLIKAALCVRHKKLPPTLHYKRPNPDIDFANSPFFVNTALVDWTPPGPRRAGVSAFGIGGTNAHVVLEEAPAAPRTASMRAAQLLIVSARTPAALDAASANLVGHLHEHREHALADIAYTLQIGRRSFAHRRAVLCHDADEAAQALASNDPARVFSAGPTLDERPVVFVFPGQGGQFVNMGLELYQTEPIFRSCVDRCAEILHPHLGLDLRRILYPSEQDAETAAAQLREFDLSQLALFVLQYALAKQWMEWGVRPQAVLGQSIGDYVAACVAGIFELPDALWLVAQRGRLLQRLPPATMLAVPLAEAEARALCSDDLALVAVNGPEHSVIAGPIPAIEALEQKLEGGGVYTRRIRTTRVSHSSVVDPILEEFARCVAQITPRAPEIPYMSSVTGGWVEAAQVTGISYWTRHLRERVRFSEALDALFQEPSRILLEIGPGDAASSLIARNAHRPEGLLSLSSLPGRRNGQSSQVHLLATLGTLWLHGVEIDWRGYHAHERRRRVGLPTYPFERQRYWVEPPPGAKAEVHGSASATPQPDAPRDPSSFLYQAAWRVTPWPPHVPRGHVNDGPRRFLVFADGGDLAARALSTLRARGDTVTIVRPGARFSESPGEEFTVHPGTAEHYQLLVQRLAAGGRAPSDVLHLWNVDVVVDAKGAAHERLEKQQERGFYSLLFLTQALAHHAGRAPVRVAVVTTGIWSVADEPVTSPEQATVLGTCLVIPQEVDFISCCCVDLEETRSGAPGLDPVLRLLSELDAPEVEAIVAYRRGRRFQRTFERAASPDGQRAQRILRPRGVYLITGGLGGIGSSLAKYLAQAVGARLVLTSRQPFPDRRAWGELLLSTAEGREPALDRHVEQIRRVQEMEALGAEVLVVQADVASRDDMAACVQQVHERFGAIHGVIHAAGVLGSGAIRGMTMAQAAQTLAPKVLGTLVLDAALRDDELDFFVHCSSLATIMGSFGQADYCAANAFQDAFAHHQRQGSKTIVTSIGWDGRREADTGDPKAVSYEFGLSPEERTEVFKLSLASGLTQVLVSTLDLEARLSRRSSARGGERPNGAAPAASMRTARRNGCVAPRNDLERGMAAIWATFFGVEPIGVTDSFFEDFNGDSLMAAHLTALMNAQLKLDLSRNALLQAPTIAALARARDTGAVSPAGSAQPSPFVELKPGASARPLFLIHPVGGHVYIYRDLAGYLEDRQRVLAIEAQGLDLRREPLQSISAMAEQYLAAVRACQPEGPYWLGGASFGGMAAYEMAQRLCAERQEVGFVAMLDTAGPGELRVSFESDDEILAYMLEIGALHPAFAAELQALPPEERLPRFLRHTGERGRLIPPVATDQLRRSLDLWRIGEKAMAAYTPSPSCFPIVYFRASERDAAHPATPERRWRELARGSFDLHEVPGNHITMNYAPNVAHVARSLTGYMRRAAGSARG